MAEETAPIVQETQDISVTTPYDWKAEIHPDVKDEPLWENVPDLKTLTKAYADATRYNVGALKLPAPDAPPEEWERVWEKLGKPAQPDDYQNTHEEPDPDPEFASKLKRVCHAANITKGQWEVLARGYNQVNNEMVEAEENVTRDTIKLLREEYGAAYDKNLDLVVRAIRQLGGEDALNELGKDGAARRPHFMKMMVKFAKSAVEAKLISGDSGSVASVEDAKEQLSKLVNSEPYLKASHPDHERTFKQVTKLFETVYN